MGFLYAFYAVAFGVASTAAPAPPAEVARLTCTVDVRAESVTCATEGEALAALAARNLRPSGDAWTAALDVENTSALLLGLRPDGSVDPAGVEVRFGAPATTRGTGAATVLDGVLRFDGALAPGQRSTAQALRFRAAAGVEAFEVSATVSAAVTPPRGTLALSPAAIRVLAPGTGALTATPRAASGALLPGGSVVYGSGDTGVATVSAAGTVTGVAVGTTTVTARSGTATASASVEVCPDLAVGGVYHTTLANGGTVCVSGYAGAEYTIFPTNQSTAAARSITVTGTGVMGVSGPPIPRQRSDEARQVLLTEAGELVEGAPLAELGDDTSILERDRRELTPLLAQGARHHVTAPPARSIGPDGARTITPGVPTVGDTWSLNVAQGCNGTPDMRAATVRAVTAHTILVTDDSNPPTTSPDGYRESSSSFVTFQQLAERFDTIAWPAVTGAFGEPTDLDANGRVVLFYTRAVNELSPPASSAVTGGYVTSRDLFASASCNLSNEGEIAYMLVPDPTGAVNSNVRTESYVLGSTIGTAGHELQHLINASRRIYVNGASGFETVWLNEGMSHISEELMFYGQSFGLTPRMNINLSNLTSGTYASRRVAAFNSYANQNYGRLRTFLQRPDLWRPFGSTDDLGNRGAIWGFLRYAADRRGGTENDFWSALVNSTSSGVDNVRQSLGLATEAEALAWFRDWNVAIYADDALSGVPAEYQISSWNFRSVYGGLGGVPHGVRSLSSGVPLTLSYAQGGSTGFLRAGVSASGFGSFRIGFSDAGAPVPVSILRTK